MLALLRETALLPAHALRLGLDTYADPPLLAERLGWDAPVIRSEQVDNIDIATQAEAQALVNSRLSFGASWYRKVQFRTYPDEALDAHNIVNLDLVYPGDGRHWYTGQWLQRTWSVGLKGATPFVDRECYVTVPWR